MPYRLLDSDYKKLINSLKESRGSDCDYVVCVAERNSPAAQREQRHKVLSGVSSFIQAHIPSQNYQPKQADIQRAVKLYWCLEKAYRSEHFEIVLRLGLIDTGAWLCQIYKNPETIQNSLNFAEKVLLCSGYGFKIKDDNLCVTRRCAYLDVYVVDAAVHAADVHIDQGNTKLGEQYEDIAKELCMTLFGELRGFDERCSRRSPLCP